MATIRRCTINDFSIISRIGRESFVETHRASASPGDIEEYVDRNYSVEAIKEELKINENQYHFIIYEGEVAGFSKIIFNHQSDSIIQINTTKLDRLYLQQKFHGIKLGKKLLDFNIELSKAANQTGMWLIVWEGNKTAIDFYTKSNFKIISTGMYCISKSHFNPYYLMYRQY